MARHELERQAQRLTIRGRETLDGSGERRALLTVFCSRRGHSVPFDACNTCGYCTGVTLDPTGRHSFIMCGGTAEEPAWRRRPDVAPEWGGLEHTQIRDVMSRNVMCVRPDVSVEVLARAFLERGISGAPVVDENGKSIGVVSKTDLVREAYENDGDEGFERVPLKLGGHTLDLGPGFHVERLAGKTVGEIMQPIAFTLAEDAPVTQAAALMAYEGVHSLPIVSHAGQVVGVLSALDVLRHLAVKAGDAISLQPRLAALSH